MSGLIQNTESKVALVHISLNSYLYNLNYSFVFLSYQLKICKWAPVLPRLTDARLLTRIFSPRQPHVAPEAEKTLWYTKLLSSALCCGKDFRSQTEWNAVDENLMNNMRRCFSRFKKTLTACAMFYFLRHRKNIRKVNMSIQENNNGPHLSARTVCFYGNYFLYECQFKMMMIFFLK